MGKIILVDENDNPVGEEEKITVHKKGLLHRAFSIVVFNKEGKILLQKRSKDKYHSGGLWSNTCCSHQKPGENTLDAAKIRLDREMGFSTELEEIFSFKYKIKFKNDLSEYEFDHVLIGYYNSDPNPDKEEVESWKWADINDLIEDMKINSDDYTYWFKILIGKLKEFKNDFKIYKR